jgi:hypothetical protein
MKFKTTRNSRFSRCLLALATAATLLNSCKKDAAEQPAPANAFNADSTLSNSLASSTTGSTIPFSQMLGVNCFTWDFVASNPGTVDATKFGLIKSFSQVRYYLDWNTLEATKGSYSYNPTTNGSWSLDANFSSLKASGMDALVDIKTCPTWLLATFPTSMQDVENVPAPYGSDLTKPASYIAQAKVAFQFAARYGANAKVSKSMLSVNTVPRWANDQLNTVKVGTNLVKFIECDNERDKWWKGPATIQTADEYAANMSAFYDGDMGKLGPGVGVKTADPTMQVVMGGLAKADTQWITEMIAWCKKNRGLKPDGSVNLCFDVINYHYYNNSTGSIGTAPELSPAASLADGVVAVSKTGKNAPPVWVTETGYDVNASSIQRAPAIGSKTAELVQADWNLRTALLYIKHDIKRVFFYELYDNAPGNSLQYSTCGFVTGTARRPSANYIMQVKNLMGTYKYKQTISTSPMVDVYTNGTKTIWALYMPTAKGSTATYSLNVGKAKATLYTLNSNSTTITSSAKTTSANNLSVAVSETPVFVSNF